ncbi:hypothetical protein SLEP1_g16402 [Rubroshorea leprosula]|uniref:O-methyltransferase C-terminal domain-containing protein n=1 Tax=Rubroshorea leprosula TaxID=152421 RepID=A0AAV5IUN5_9ROSI|nr:hypothetical protein SLEP1_g16402 [Rubroshorea leprosula]
MVRLRDSMDLLQRAKLSFMTKMEQSWNHFHPIKHCRNHGCSRKISFFEGGNLFERAFGMPIYQYISQDGELNQGFNKALRVEHVARDMFLNIPKADALMVKDVLHNWGDKQCVKVLKNCYNALPSQGKLIIVNYVMPEGAEPSNLAKHVSQLDVIMFIHQGGRQRTEREFKVQCKAAGFSDFHLVYCVYNGVGVMECCK